LDEPIYIWVSSFSLLNLPFDPENVCYPVLLIGILTAFRDTHPIDSGDETFTVGS
jgi:hypothetical protein